MNTKAQYHVTYSQCANTTEQRRDIKAVRWKHHLAFKGKFIRTASISTETLKLKELCSDVSKPEKK